MRYLLPILVMLLPACSSREHELDPVYAPLEQIRERPNVVLSETAITTIGDTSYVVDLHDWLERHPEGSLTYRAVLLHEQEHSKRQLKAGTLGWLSRYLTDKDFMWAEEQRGWYWELKALHSGGATVNVDGVANALSKYKTATGTRMVSAADAKVWVIQVLAGQWAPPAD